MTKQWKTLQNTQRRAPIGRLISWLLEKENRASAAWLGSLIGIGFVFAYQTTLSVGFTPQVNLTEGALVLGKAALMGLLFFAAMYAGVFAPAASLRLLEIDVDKIAGLERGNVLRGLMRRCLYAQVFGGFYPAALFLFLHAYAPHHLWIAITTALISIGALLGALNSSRIPGETRLLFYFSVPVIGSFAFFSLLIFVLVCGLKDDLQSLALAGFSWLALTVVSAILSTVRKKDRLLSIFAALLIFIVLLKSLGQLLWPFRAVAYAVGIAQPGTVTLVLNESSCRQMESAVAGLRDLTCSGANSGVLRDVEVLNSWGSRWLIQISKEETIRVLSFDGSGAMISKDRSRKNSNE